MISSYLLLEREGERRGYCTCNTSFSLQASQCLPCRDPYWGLQVPRDTHTHHIWYTLMSQWGHFMSCHVITNCQHRFERMTLNSGYFVSKNVQFPSIRNDILCIVKSQKWEFFCWISRTIDSEILSWKMNLKDEFRFFLNEAYF